MKRFFILIPALLFGAEFQFGGYLNIDTRILLKDYDFNFNETRLDFFFKGKNNNFHFYTEFWLKEALKDVNTMDDLVNIDKNSITIELKESYLNLSNFPFDFVDLRVGKQRTAWGTAYIFNPTDNIDPLDLEDIWDFERKLSSLSLKMTLFLYDFSFQTIYKPFFSPSRLPNERLFYVFYPIDSMVSSVKNLIEIPERSNVNSIYGLRIKRNVKGTDLSLSYVYGRYNLPFPESITVVSTTSGIKLNNKLVYPKLKTLGLDFATSIDKFGLWGEFAYFIPESLNCVIDKRLVGLGVSDSLILHKNYYKYVLGIDYRRDENLYLLLQYVYGFPYDSGENINDFILLHSSLKFLDSKIELNLNYAFEIYDFKNKKFSHLLSPEISFYPLSNIMIKTGMKYIMNDYGNLGKLKDEGNFYIVFKYNY